MSDKHSNNVKNSVVGFESDEGYLHFRDHNRGFSIEFNQKDRGQVMSFVLSIDQLVLARDYINQYLGNFNG